MGIGKFFAKIFGQHNEQTLDEKLRAELEAERAAAPTPEKTTLNPYAGYAGPKANVFLKDCGEMKIAVIKVLKDVLDLSLIDAKQASDRAPGYVAYDIPVPLAQELRRELEKVGASAHIEPV